ncbi:MAG: multicopper oxidase domain-containing protein [Actinomycetota bacterium]
MPPAKRYDVLVTASKHPGQTWLKTLTYFQGDDTYPTVNLMQLKVSGDLLPSLPLPTGTIPTSHPNLASAPIAQKRTLNLSESADGSVMYINGKNFSMNKSIFGAPAILGTVEQWTILNETTETHPFHIHTDHFQVMSTNGLSQPYIGEQDIVTVPPKKDGIPGKVVIRIAFTDFLGRVMFHCHIAAHEDAGMMSFINVVKG